MSRGAQGSTSGAVRRVQRWVATVLGRLAWLPTLLTVLLPVAASVLFVFMGDLDDLGDWAFLVVATSLLLLNAVVAYATTWWRRQDSEADDDEANRLRVATKDALQPLAELTASMPYENRRDREASLQLVATQAVASLVLLLKDVDRLRAVVFAMDPGLSSMHPMAYHGRGSTPSSFTTGNRRGDHALQLVRAAVSLFVRDLDEHKPEEWEGSGADYRTFISAAITNGEYAYGMVTVDAPRAGDLGENDRHIVSLVADLLAIAFAEADR